MLYIKKKEFSTRIISSKYTSKAVKELEFLFINNELSTLDRKKTISLREENNLANYCLL